MTPTKGLARSKVLPRIKADQLRDRVLRSRGLSVTKPTPKKHRIISRGPKPVPARLKTYAMRMIEQESGKPIEIILVSHSLRQIEKKYSIDYTTAWKWRHRLKDYLPKKEEECGQEFGQES